MAVSLPLRIRSSSGQTMYFPPVYEQTLQEPCTFCSPVHSSSRSGLFWNPPLPLYCKSSQTPPNHFAHDHGVNFPKALLCFSFTLVVFWDSLLLPNTQAGYFEILPSSGICLTFLVSAPIIQQQVSVSLLQIFQILGHSPNTHTAHASVFCACPLHSPCLEHLASLFLRDLVCFLKPRSVSSTFTMISRTDTFQKQFPLSLDSLVLCQNQDTQQGLPL